MTHAGGNFIFERAGRASERGRFEFRAISGEAKRNEKKRKEDE